MAYNNLYNQNGRLLGRVMAFYRSSNSYEMVLDLDNGTSYRFAPGAILRDRQGDWRIRNLEESFFDSLRYMHWVDRVMEEVSQKKEKLKTAPMIKKVIFNPPATIVYWTDDTKTVVKCSENDMFDPEKGLAMAIAKRCGGNNGGYYKEIRHWIEQSGFKQA